MQKGILMVTAIAGAENCAAVLSKQFGMLVEKAASRREALGMLRRREFAIVVIDESLVESRDADGPFADVDELRRDQRVGAVAASRLRRSSLE